MTLRRVRRRSRCTTIHQPAHGRDTIPAQLNGNATAPSRPIATSSARATADRPAQLGDDRRGRLGERLTGMGDVRAAFLVRRRVADKEFAVKPVADTAQVALSA